MNMETYEETRLRKDDSWAKYMVEGMDVSLLTWNGKVGQQLVPSEHTTTLAG